MLHHAPWVFHQVSGLMRSPVITSSGNSMGLLPVAKMARQITSAGCFSGRRHCRISRVHILFIIITGQNYLCHRHLDHVYSRNLHKRQNGRHLVQRSAPTSSDRPISSSSLGVTVCDLVLHSGRMGQSEELVGSFYLLSRNMWIRVDKCVVIEFSIPVVVCDAGVRIIGL